jgi:antitoxin (DNA-binding transcriptional repressor) of toxin-antitoxin stability system
MKTLKLKEVQARLGAWVDVAQSESVLVTRRGKPAALIIGIEGHDLEDLRLETDPAFWAMIEERRRQTTMSRAELDEYLRARDRDKDRRDEEV